MPDFRRLVHEHVHSLGLPADRERKVIDEWAAQFEESYDALRAGGLSEDEAWRELQRDTTEWDRLCRDLIDAEPLVQRLANPERGPLSRRPTRGLLRSLRETLASGLGRDLRCGVRLLFRERAYSATIVLTLAVCLGANAAVFAVVNAVLLRPLPFPEPDRIVGMGDVYPTITPNDILSNDAPSYADRRAAVTALEEQALFTFWYDTIVIDGVAEELRGMRATPSLFRVLRVSPVLGRAFTDEEGEVGGEHHIILSHGLWQRLYGADRAAIGKTLRLGWTGEPYTIVGVMPHGFSFFDQGDDGHAQTAAGGVQFWIPLALRPEQKADSARTRYGFFHIGRLRPGATVDQVRSQLDAILASNIKRFPQFRFADLGVYTSVLPLQDGLTRDIRRTLYLLWAGAGFVLLIGVLNVGNLALARASVRAREFATRLALGAGRVALTRQLMVEALVPTAIGGAAALALGSGMLMGLELAGVETLPNATDVHLDATTVGFVVLVSLALGLLVGLVPATMLHAGTLNRKLVDSSRTGTAGPVAHLYRRSLVVVQVGLSVVLLVGASLLFTSFRNLLGVDPGFTADRVVTATIFPPPSRYPDTRAVVNLSDRLLEQVRAIPGVQAAGLTSNIALSGFESPATVSAERISESGAPEVVPSIVGVTPGYFEAMNTRIVRGRNFVPSDGERSLPVAIVDERLAARLWPGQEAIGRRLYCGEAGPFTVVGVVREVRFESLGGSSDGIGAAYFPHTQAPPLRRLRWIAVKTSGDPAGIVRSLRAALAAVDPMLPLGDIQTMDQRTSRTLVSQRLATTLASMFASVALFLSLLGIYGVLAHAVTRRTREFGIRLALGSSVRHVFRLVLGEGALLIGVGLGLGVAGALATARAIEGQLFGVRPTDPVLLAAVVVGTGCVALLACLAPARRATRVDPVRVLAEE